MTKQVKTAKVAKSVAKVATKSNGKLVAKAARKPAKVSKASTTDKAPRAGAGVAIDLGAKVTFVSENTKRGASRERFSKYRKGLTLAKLLATNGGPNRGDFKYDIARGFIKVS